MKKIALIGGTGKVGQYIASTALKSGFKVRLLARNPDKIKAEVGIEVIKGNVQDLQVIRTILMDCDVVINTFGQPIKENPIYSKVTNDILSVMKELGIKRYIGVTGASLDINGDRKSFINRMGAKLFSLLFPKMIEDKEKEYRILQTSSIDWTLIRLPFVVDGDETNVIKECLVNMPGSKISSKDVASFLIDEIMRNRYINKTPFISN